MNIAAADIEEPLNLPAYQRFLFVPHVLSTLAATVVGLLMTVDYSAESITQSTFGWDALGMTGQGLIAVLILVPIVTLPITLVCVKLAKKFDFHSFWQFGLLGVLGAPLLLLIFIAIEVLALPLTGISWAMLGSQGIVNFLHFLAHVLWISLQAVPASVAGLLAYRLISNQYVRFVARFSS